MEWKELLESELSKDTDMIKRVAGLKEVLKAEYQNKTIYPPKENIFRAFNQFPLDELKVVVIAQDPYFNENQANGLAFGVNPEIPMPPSLINIFKEVKDDIGTVPTDRTLLSWAKQGVLLLNSVLTVEAGKPGSHRNLGWEYITNNLIQRISQEKSGLVFMLWGNYAQSKIGFINERKHLILTCSHPSPLGAYKSFFGCRHFSKANHYLESKGKTPIDWVGENK